MTVPVTLAQITKLAPKALSGYLNAFATGGPTLGQFGISDNPLRVAHFMAQMLHESSALTIQVENLNYSAERLPIVWPKRFKPAGPLAPAEFAHNEEALANEVYGGRMGNTDPGDGYKYRGRGLLQLTGKDNYIHMTSILRDSIPDAPDLVLNPDAVIDQQWCLKVAAVKWFDSGCNAKADADSITGVTTSINGGTIGIDERTQWLKRTKAIWH